MLYTLTSELGCCLVTAWERQPFAEVFHHRRVALNARTRASSTVNSGRPEPRTTSPDRAFSRHPMKIVTWNVNGIRARQTELQEFLEREQPDVLCLQEIKASLDQLPVWICQLEGNSCYWHGGRGYSGVALHVRAATYPNPPAFHHPAFDFEHRIVTVQLPNVTVASVYVPNGGKDFPADGAPADHLYLVDPLGNLMMRFPRDPEPARVIKDLQRLLRASRFG